MDPLLYIIKIEIIYESNPTARSYKLYFQNWK